MTAVECTGLDSLLALGACALADEGDLRAGREHYDAAYREAERVGDVEAMAEAALGIGGLWVHEHRSTAGAILLDERLRRALAAVDPGSPLALRLRIRLAGEADYRGGTATTIMPLLEQARRYGGPVARAEALSIAHHCLLDPEYAGPRRSLAAELVAESFRTGRRSDLLMGLLWQTVDLFLEADPHAGRRLGELRELLTGGDHLAVGFVVDAIDVMLAIRSGDLARAESLATACLARGTEAGDADATGWYGAQLVAIRWYQGRLVEVLPMLAELADSPTLSAIDNAFRSALAVAAALAGDRPAALSALAALCGDDLADLPRSSSWLVTMHGAVEAAYLLDDADTAARAYELLRPYADRPMVASIGAACFGSVHHALGVASLTFGEVDRAVEHFGAAIRHNLALGHRPAVAASRQRLAEALARRGTPTAATCTRHGRHWRVALGHRGVLVEHRIGMAYLAVLLANPGREIDAIDLAAGAAALEAPDGSSQPVLDRAAIRAYQDRLAVLRRELDAGHDTGRVRAERDWLLTELAGAAGLGGRTRAFAGNRERARIAVGKAIRRAVEHIARTDPVIGDHLAGAVRTGMQCAYHGTAWNGMERP